MKKLDKQQNFANICWSIIAFAILYTPRKQSLWGGILDSPCLSVCPYFSFRTISPKLIDIMSPNFLKLTIGRKGRSLLFLSRIQKTRWPPTALLIHKNPYFSFRTISQKLIDIMSPNFQKHLFWAKGRLGLFFVKIQKTRWPPAAILKISFPDDK